MSNTNHTPGKLFSQAAVVIVKIENNVYHVCDCNSPLGQHHRINGYEEAKANAERIVRCWNSHDELFDIAKSMLPMYELIAKYMPQYYSAVEHENIKAAIKKATNE